MADDAQRPIIVRRKKKKGGGHHGGAWKIAYADFVTAMFALGRAELQPYARDILLMIGKALNDVDNKVTVAGHTDATQYASGEKGYSNWELSADRANASRRTLVAGGMEEQRVVRVYGMA